MLRQDAWRRGAWLPWVVAAVELARLGALLGRPDGRLANTTADDAFYYLVAAKNFAATGRWTFDGLEPASGFHLLWGYLLAALFRVAPGIGFHAVYGCAQLVQAACLTGAAYLVVRTAVRVFGPGAEWGVAVVFLSGLSLTVGSMMMESSLVIVLAAAALALVCREREAGMRELWLGAGLGLAGVLARSDFGVLAVGLVVAGAGLRRVKVAGALLAGAAAGLVLVALHTHWISGEWVQSSARVKFFWAGVQGYTWGPARRLVVGLFDAGWMQSWPGWLQHGLTAVARIVVRLLLLGALVAAWQGRRDGRLWTVAGLLVAVAGYLAVYRFASADLQNWYVASFEVPVALLAGAGVSACRGQGRKLAAGAAALLCALGVGANVFPGRDLVAPLYAAGIYVREHPELRPVGAWNAGAIAYFSGGRVVNLDGLVNDRVYGFAVRGRLLEYVQARELRTIVDVPVMVRPEVMRDYGEEAFPRRYGYADGKLQACLEDVGPAGTDEVRVYRVRCP